MMRLLSVVGARPNFMKIAPIVDELKNHPQIEHCLVHSGQHYDETLSGNFFSDLGLPRPDVNLEVGSGSHAMQTAEVMKRIEPVLVDHRPDMVLVVGDVNSTLAAAITAAKLGIAVAHIEAGLRSFDLTMPEEINRRLTDAISTLLFATESSGVENLQREGIPPEKVFFVGNVMIDCLLRHREAARQSPILEKLGVRKNGANCLSYGVLTLHRPSNVDDGATLRDILSAARSIASELPIFFPIHPRTQKKIESFGLQGYLASDGDQRGLIPLDPLGYLDFLALNDNAQMVLTDSGGVQEETTILGVPCLTIRENTERPATVAFGTNQVVGVDPSRILAAGRAIVKSNPLNSNILKSSSRQVRCPPLWDGKAAPRIVSVIREHLAQGQKAVNLQFDPAAI